MRDISSIRTALCGQVTAQTGLQCLPRMPDQINPPLAVILPGAPYAKYGVTLGENKVANGLPHVIPVATEYNFILAIFVTRTSIEQAQITVDQYLGFEPSAPGTSIPEALAFDPTLGGVVEFCEAIQVQTVGDVEIAGQTYFQGRIVVVVSAHQDLS